MVKRKNMKLVKYINNAGYCSRREAEKLIVGGEIFVNREKIVDISYELKDFDRVFHGDNEIKFSIRGADIYLYYKPVGVICSHDDPTSKNTVFANVNIQSEYHLVTVGRLDVNSEGLLIITNNKQLASAMERSKLERIYKVRVFGNLERLRANTQKTITFEGIEYSNFDIYAPEQEAANTWVYVTLREGRNHEVRNIMQYFGLEVNRLIRIQYGPFKLEALKSNEVLYVKYSDVRLKNFLAELDAASGFKQRGEDKPHFERDGRFKKSFNSDRRDSFRDRPRGERSEADRRPREEGFAQRSEGSSDRKPRSFGDRPRRDFRDGPRKFDSDRPRRDSFRDRPRGEEQREGSSDTKPRSFGDRPRRDFRDGPRKFDSDRPRRDSFRDRPRGAEQREGSSDTKSRSFGDRPRRDFRDGPRKFDSDRPRRDSFRDRPRGAEQREGSSDTKSRSFGDRPRRDFRDGPRKFDSDRPRAGSFRDKPRGFGSDKPRFDRKGDRKVFSKDKPKLSYKKK